MGTEHEDTYVNTPTQKSPIGASEDEETVRNTKGGCLSSTRALTEQTDGPYKGAKLEGHKTKSRLIGRAA